MPNADYRTWREWERWIPDDDTALFAGGKSLLNAPNRLKSGYAILRTDKVIIAKHKGSWNRPFIQRRNPSSKSHAFLLE